MLAISVFSASFPATRLLASHSALPIDFATFAPYVFDFAAFALYVSGFAVRALYVSDYAAFALYVSDFAELAPRPCLAVYAHGCDSCRPRCPVS